MTPNPQVPVLSTSQIEELGQFTTPTVANALELSGSWDRISGVVSPRIRALFPDLKPVVGYAATALIATRQPAHKRLYADWKDYWKYVTSIPEPRIAVGQDIDPEPTMGSIWGEVQATIHVALGCVGAVVDGAMRDLDEMRALGFACFAREVSISHRHAHFVDFGSPVQVGGVIIQPGDLIHADQHGVMVIPKEVASGLPDLCRQIVAAEGRLLAVCKQRNTFTLKRLVEAYDAFMDEYPVERPSAL
jgi:regulator of RNase E activity RraA